MMKKLPIQKRTLGLLAVLVPLLALFFYVALRSGPLAPVPVVLGEVESKSLAPGLFGIGTVEARYSYKIGPTAPGRLKSLDVHVGDYVKAGQVLGEIDSVDLDERIRAQEVSIERATAQLREATERSAYAESEAIRYQELQKARSASEETVAAKEHEWRIAETQEVMAREELSRLRAEREAMATQRKDFYLTASADGLIVSRNVDPGSTVVAGQAVVELIDPDSLWIDVRFDQVQGDGLAADLSAEIVLRSQRDRSLNGRVLRREPLADVITEEILAKVLFDEIPNPLPSVGELAEVTVTLPKRPETTVVPNSAIRNINGQQGVWQISGGDLRFAPVSIGAADLEGNIEVSAGLDPGDQIVIYSADNLTRRSRLRIVEQIPGVTR